MAGVSTATASRALSNPDLVAISTRKAVQAAAENFGYKVNLVARSLRKQCSQAILVLIPALDNQFYPEIFHGIEVGAHRRGYSIVLGFTSRDHWREPDYLEILNDRRADGLIVVDPHVRKLVENGVRRPVPVVQLLGAPAGAMATVRIDDAAAAAAVTQHFISLGHRRIAHVRGGCSSFAAERRVAGYRQALEDAGIAFDDDLLIHGDNSYASGSAAIDALTALQVAPTAVFCADDTMALGALWRCKQRGLSVPGDISIAGIDDIYSASISDPPLTTVRQPRQDIGAAGAEMLIAMLEGRRAMAREIVLPHELVVRSSTAAPHS
jgi:LacI family repressor for deo operon, udp, cdd, tsx, nupC, and nupG